MGIISSLGALAIAIAGLLIVIGARRQAAKLFVYTAVVLALCAFVPSPATILFFATHALPLWALILLIPFAALFTIFATIRIFEAAIAAVYGRNVAFRLTAVALGQTFYWMARAFGFVFLMPFRLFSRRPRIDDLLQDWRR